MTESEGTAPLNVISPNCLYRVPALLCKRRAIEFKSEVLPLPDGPIIMFRSPD